MLPFRARFTFNYLQLFLFTSKGKENLLFCFCFAYCRYRTAYISVQHTVVYSSCSSVQHTEVYSIPYCTAYSSVPQPVFRIRNVLVQIQNLGSVPWNYGSESYYFLQWQNNQSFFFYIFLLIRYLLSTFLYLRFKRKNCLKDR